MRVFVTGATGFVGAAVVRELQATGHDVLGLARSDASAAALAALGVAVHRGALADIESLSAGARMCDGVIHTAFNHEWATTTREQAAETDRQVVEAMAGALEGSGKPLVITSGTAIMSPAGRSLTESDVAPSPVGRALVEEVVIAASGRSVRGSIVRLSPSVHGAGDHGFVPMLIDLARRKGVSAYVGEGGSRWPAVHRLDAAQLFRLALEKAAPGSRWHGAAEEGVPMRAIAETIGEGLGIPVRSMDEVEARAHFEWFAHFVAIDNPTSSAVTREALGWKPQEVDLLTDMRGSGYFG